MSDEPKPEPLTLGIDQSTGEDHTFLGWTFPGVTKEAWASQFVGTWDFGAGPMQISSLRADDVEVRLEADGSTGLYQKVPNSPGTWIKLEVNDHLQFPTPKSYGKNSFWPIQYEIGHTRLHERDFKNLFVLKEEPPFPCPPVRQQGMLVFTASLKHAKDYLRLNYGHRNVIISHPRELQGKRVEHLRPIFLPDWRLTPSHKAREILSIYFTRLRKAWVEETVKLSKSELRLNYLSFWEYRASRTSLGSSVVVERPDYVEGVYTYVRETWEWISEHERLTLYMMTEREIVDPLTEADRVNLDGELG